MSSLPQVAAAMQHVLTTVADEAASRTGFVRRRSKVSGAVFVQNLVLGWLGNPQAGGADLTRTPAGLGVGLSRQALSQRGGPSAAALLKEVLEAAVRTLVVAHPVAVPLLARFNGGLRPGQFHGRPAAGVPSGGGGSTTRRRLPPPENEKSATTAPSLARSSTTASSVVLFPSSATANVDQTVTVAWTKSPGAVAMFMYLLIARPVRSPVASQAPIPAPAKGCTSVRVPSAGKIV